MREFFDGLARRAAADGNRTAIVSDNAILSYAALCGKVRAMTAAARALPERVGLLVGQGADGIVFDLALSFAGKEIVPLPEFFSEAQLAHIVQKTGLTHGVTDAASADRVQRLGLVAQPLGATAVPGVTPASEARRIIFTSGTTGTPKGVCLSGTQMLASADALAEASGATGRDRYLSVLPNSLLLEQIAGIYLPLSVGAMIVLPGAHGSFRASQFSDCVEQSKATATVLVPELLYAWLNELRIAARRAPSSLRFVAVGGASVSAQLAEEAWSRGLPIYEGYGLSECCSVVCVNRPGARRPLKNVQIAIDDGEIVVSGPTVTRGYVGEPPANGTWRTGDLGALDDAGFVRIIGRKDNVIVTGAGRNVSPEWIEQVIEAGGHVKRCVVVGHRQELAALIVPKNPSLCGDDLALRDLVVDATHQLPDYARPRRYAAMTEQQLGHLDLFTPNQRPRRALISSVFDRVDAVRVMDVQGETA